MAKRTSSGVKRRPHQQRIRVASRGRQDAFEGPVGAGKSTIVQLVAQQLKARPVAVFALPGREPGSLCAYVYELHHDPKAFSVQQMSPAAKQLLHVAAHADFVEVSPRPRMNAGETVLLDRDFVITRADSQLAEDAGAPWRRRQKRYLGIAEREASSHPVHLVFNDGDVNEAVAEVARLFAGHENE